MNAETDAERFTALLQTVGEIYDQTVSPARATMYFGQLRAYEYEIVELAIAKFLDSEASKFGFPKPIHIREIIEGSQSEQEANAWLAVNESIRRIGVWQSLIVADPAIADAIVRVFGSWASLCQQANESSPYVWENRRRDFVAAFRLARKRERTSTEPVLLGGLCEMQNRASGRFPKRQPYGVILADGRVQSRYLAINEATGLPATPLPLALALPPERAVQRQLPAAEADEPGSRELVGQDAIMSLEAAFRKLLQDREFPSGAGKKGDNRDVVAERDARRKAEIRRQATEAGNSGKNVSTEQASGVVRARKTARAKHTDRTPNHGGGSAKARARVRVREADREKLARGSRVAGVPDHLRTGGERVRERDPRGAGIVDNEAIEGRSGKSRVRRMGDRPTRRKT